MSSHTKHGRWSEPGVPHKGWRCVDFIDLGRPSETCGMCEGQEIRYVHVMEHADYPESIRAGCVCAENMEADTVAAPGAAKDRERRAKSLEARRWRWVERVWRVSRRGNPFLNVDHFNVTLFRKQKAWSGLIEDRKSGQKIFAKRRYADQNSAKLAAFDAVAILKDRRENSDS